jgi:uncharacterized repeat protein (TIGR03803 family)
VFKINNAGKESVLHSFAGGASDGETPVAGLIAVNGALYGTTANGGAFGNDGTGTFFKITPAGKETVLHNFGGAGDGADPSAGLIAYPVRSMARRR